MDFSSNFLLNALKPENLLSKFATERMKKKKVDINGELTRDQSTDGTKTSLTKKLAGYVLGEASKGWEYALIELKNWFISSILTIYNFDWAQTDKALQQQKESNVNAVITQIGEAVGSGSVYMATAALGGVAKFKFPVIAGNVLLRLAEEGGEEMESKLRGILTTSRQKIVENYMIDGLLTVRQMRLFGQQPISEQKEPWTIAGELEKKVEAIPDAKWKAFFTGVKEGFEDALFEALYVISYGIDEAFLASKLAIKRSTGKEKMVELIPDKTNDNETVYIRGRQEEIKPVIMQTQANYKLVKNRDIGQLVGQPLMDYVKAQPHVRKLAIVFRGKQTPPYRSENGKQIKIVTYNIPDVKVGLTWEKIKRACKPFNWGKFRCTANLSNGRQMAVYGATPVEAEDTLRDLLSLSNAEILTLSVTEEKDRKAVLKKDTTRVWAAYATLLVRQTDATDPDYVDLEGKGYAEYSQRIPLWMDQEPDDLEPLR